MSFGDSIQTGSESPQINDYHETHYHDPGDDVDVLWHFTVLRRLVATVLLVKQHHYLVRRTVVVPL